MGEYAGPRSARAFLAYAQARQRRDRDRALWRSYVAACLRGVAVGERPALSWDDVLERDRRPPAPPMDGAGIADDVIARAGLRVM